ncbi:ribose transport system permease protein [Mobilisporobacter senegalensis]|uniref:Ribose transport system permease protein n=1 Tax=Mobilisporobacter senegalensis TaxID=1329262 RepID=A0A3N1XQJ0_9FIRM|nr:ABC transporter permease [Mobilisporobacter senegalensis]ROR27352.1 ribose transport system permease protein [Mobilisporobacter senegalensis]
MKEMNKQSTTLRIIDRLKSSNSSDIMTVLGAYLILVIFFSIKSPYFLRVNNFLNIGLYAAIMGAVACSMTFINVSGCIDISVGSQIAVVGMVVATLSRLELPIGIIILGGLLAGGLCGAFNGFFITKIKINPFITTIASMQILRGIAYLISNGQTIVVTNDVLKFIGRGRFFGIPVTLIILIIMYLIFGFVGKYTVFGRSIYMIGGNAQSSFLSGIKVQKTKFIIYAINGVMAGAAGIMLTAQTGAGLPMAAAETNMQALSAVILGGAGLTGGKGTILGTFIGVFVLSTLNNGMVMLNIQTFWQQVIVGTVLLIAVAIDAIKGGSLKRKI